MQDEWTAIGGLQLRVLALIQEATTKGLMSWERSESDDDWYSTRKGPIESYIHFKRPSYNGDEGSDRDFVEVGGAGRFMIGTAGWTLALEILAAGNQEWRDHISRLRHDYEARIDSLEDAITQASTSQGQSTG